MQPSPPREGTHMTTTTLGYVISYVDDVAATLRFYTEAFGFEQRFLTPAGDYGELDTGQTTMGFASADLAETNLATAGGFRRFHTGDLPPAVAITFLTTDPGTVAQRAIAAGATPYVEPTHKPWGQTVAYVRDPNGALIEIATPVAS